ncbi:hypothetical protein EB796_007999 [Bugula neritina]|uniref:Uncharacterized protein n=1 Tax=Bugula neritina TaxID=10212 RepID=A0A7J7K626_BUGNE|nr:hypothetical protein EB796_007999 [Bugula neritina]
MRTKNDGLCNVSKKIVCLKAFKSLFCITKEQLETIRKSLIETEHLPQDGRGRHDNRPHRLSDYAKQAVLDHIKTFTLLKSYLGDYLLQELNTTRMRTLFQDAHPPYDVSHETYHNLLYENFNISFGYPRKDTCSTCDELVLKIQYAELKGA